VYAFITPATPYLVLALGLVLLGAGISLTAAPATATIMSAVPHHKAGVGSAVNDTTREVGGALGIAILGSIASALYRSAIDLKNVELPPGAAKAARESLGAATAIASQVPGTQLAARAGDAFTHSLNVTSVVAAALALIAAAAVALVFNHRTEQDAADAFAAASGAGPLPLAAVAE